MTTCIVPLFGGKVCGAAVHRAARTPRDWGWADESGSFFGPRFPSDPYEALAGMAQDMRRYGAAYSRLKANLDLCGPNIHQHRATSVAAPRNDQPECCGWPGYLSPSGWECRGCRAALQPKPVE
jgi:hypothetical protein